MPHRHRLVTLSISLALALIATVLLLALVQNWSAQAQSYVQPLEPQILVTMNNLGLYGARLDDQNGIRVDAANNLVYVCTHGVYGLYRSTDLGKNWSPLTGTLGGCRSMDLDATNQIVYYAQDNVGVARSSDFGLTWQRILTPPEEDDNNSSFSTRLIVVDPITPTTLFVGTSGGENTIYRSEDDGVTWQHSQFSANGVDFSAMLDTLTYEIVVDPSDSRYVYAAVGTGEIESQDRGIYASQDNGLTFRRVLSDSYGLEMGLIANRRGTLFATANKKYYRSWDHGAHWEQIHQDSEAQAGDFYSLHPTLTDTLWINGWRSDDQGDTWIRTGFLAPVVHPTITDTYYLWRPYGIARSTDAGAKWEDVTQGLEEVQASRISVDPTDPQRYFVVATGGLASTADDGAHWIFPLLPEDYLDVRIDPQVSQTVYLTNFGWPLVFKSTNGGLDWDQREIDEGLGSYTAVHQIVFDPENSQIAYVAVSTEGPPEADHFGGVYKTENGGDSWLTTSLYDVPVQTVLAVDQQTLYAGAMNPWNDDQKGGIYKSSDSGATWQHIGLQGLPIRLVEGNPQDPETIYAGAMRDGLYISHDGGLNWEHKLEEYDPWSLVVNPDDPDNLFIAVDREIQVSWDGGETWQLYYQASETEGAPRVLYFKPAPPTTSRQASLPKATLLVGNSRGLYRMEPVSEYRLFLAIVQRH